MPFLAWSPEGQLAYNPYAHVSHTEITEITDKALAGETFTEPHYLRQAQRCIANAVRVMQAAEIPVTPGSLALHMRPVELEAIVRRHGGGLAEEIQECLDSLGERGQRELTGVRDRLAILAESDARNAVEPEEGRPELDQPMAVRASCAQSRFPTDPPRGHALQVVAETGRRALDTATLPSSVFGTKLGTKFPSRGFAQSKAPRFAGLSSSG